MSGVGCGGGGLGFRYLGCCDLGGEAGAGGDDGIGAVDGEAHAGNETEVGGFAGAVGAFHGFYGEQWDGSAFRELEGTDGKAEAAGVAEDVGIIDLGDDGVDGSALRGGQFAIEEEVLGEGYGQGVADVLALGGDGGGEDEGDSGAGCWRRGSGGDGEEGYGAAGATYRDLRIACTEGSGSIFYRVNRKTFLCRDEVTPPYPEGDVDQTDQGWDLDQGTYDSDKRLP